jgi:predicted secreted Zn-dependent protease
MPAMNNPIPPLLFVLAALTAPAARAEVHETLDYEHYDAHASPGKLLSTALSDASPFRPGKQIFHSATAWNIDWQVRPAPTSDGRCAVAQVSIELKGTMMLPRLVGGEGEQQQRFEQYLSRLREHELGHFEIGREAARAMEKQLYALAPARSCADLQSAARDAGARLLPRYEAMGDAYDLKTGHGRSQGAWLEE